VIVRAGGWPLAADAQVVRHTPGDCPISAPRLQPPSILESSLYCPDLDAAERFYRNVFGLEVVARQSGRHVFLRCGQGMVLLFNPDATADPTLPTGGPPMVPHGAHGPGHLAFRMLERDIERWRAQLTTAGVPIEAEVLWPQGGHSLYLRDPAGNSLELATAALWGLTDSPVSGGA
jgi:catechol 2,3-dioxygenase-like lactoylglutathione lyase family enzyme